MTKQAVTSKIGAVLRDHARELIDAPLPAEMQRLLAELKPAPTRPEATTGDTQSALVQPATEVGASEGQGLDNPGSFNP